MLLSTMFTYVCVWTCGHSHDDIIIICIQKSFVRVHVPTVGGYVRWVGHMRFVKHWINKTSMSSGHVSAAMAASVCVCVCAQFSA